MKEKSNEELKKELQESQSTLNSFFNQSTAGAFFMMLDEPVTWNDKVDKKKVMDYVFDHQRITKINKTMLLQYKSTKKDFIGLTPKDLFAHDLEYGKSVWTEFFDNGKLHIDTDERRLDGSQLWIRGDYECLYDSKGRITGHFGLQIDITESKLAEDALKKSELLLLSTMDSQKDTIIFSIDKNYNYLTFNKAHSDAMKYVWNAEVKLGMNILDCIKSDDDRLLAKKNYDRALKGKSHSNIQKLGTVNPAYYESFFNPIWDDKNEIIGCTGLARNITKRMQADKELRNSYAFNESLLKTIPFGMHIVDETGTVLFQSDNFKDIFGESAVGEKCWDLYRDDKKQCSDCPLFKGINIGKTEVYESHGVLGDRIFDISHTGMMYEGKKAMLEIFQDITERMKAELELIAAKERSEECDRLKTAFLQNMSHEIRTPMNGILGFAELLKKPNITIEKQQDYLRIIEKSGQRMLNTINSIVEISKIESGLITTELKSLNINEQLSEINNLLKPEVEKKGLILSYRNALQDNEAEIITDQKKLISTLSILIKNAIKFTDKGSIEFGYLMKDAYLEFFVKDTGIGIPKERQDSIFERFIQADIEDKRAFQGAGLGLAISKYYVEVMDGKIWVESQVGKGTTFYFTIPYNLDLQKKIVFENKVSQDIATEYQVKNLKILVAEDDEVSDLLISETIQGISSEVLHAITGVEAVDACRNNPDLDLILMDIRMPKMDGYEATAKIRQFNKDVVIIAQTAFGLKGDREKSIQAGCNDYISKPVDMALLMEVIQKHVNK